MTPSPAPGVATPATRPSSPPRVRVIVLVAVVGYLFFIALRLAAHGGDASAFVAAGDGFTDAREAPELAVADDSLGYDGQFFHRLARSPLSLERTDHGTTFDRPAYRQARIGYPALAWVASAGGQAPLVPWALIAVNLGAIGALTAGLATLARRAERSPWLALVGAGWSGFLVATARDLSEVVAAALLVGAILALRDRRWVLATLALTAAGLSRETTLVLALGIVAAALAAHLASRWRRWSTWDARVPVAVGLVPVLATGAWRAWLASAWAGAPDTGPEIPSFVGPPLVPLVRQLGRFATAGDAVDLIQLLQVVAVVATLVLLGRALLEPRAGQAHERIALIGALLVLAMVPAWDRGVVFLRWPSDAVVLGIVVGLGATRVDWRRVGLVVGSLGIVTGLMWISI